MRFNDCIITRDDTEIECTTETLIDELSRLVDVTPIKQRVSEIISLEASQAFEKQFNRSEYANKFDLIIEE